jgi:hypothetical protein
MPTANAITASSAVGFALFQERKAGNTTDRIPEILTARPHENPWPAGVETGHSSASASIGEIRDAR